MDAAVSTALKTNMACIDSSNGQAAQNVYVLLRFDKGNLVKVRAVAAGCHLNAGGVNFDWITGVKPEESIAFLAGLVNQQPDHSRTVEGALLAISFHAAPEATRLLEQIASSSASEHTREQAAFWLGVQRGHDGFVALKSLENKSTDDARFREKLTFDFSQNSDPGADDELLHMAKFDATPRFAGRRSSGSRKRPGNGQPRHSLMLSRTILRPM
jgi:hypothetical protein